MHFCQLLTVLLGCSLLANGLVISPENSYKLKIYSLGSDSKIPIGSLTYNQEATRWTIIPTIEQQDQNLKDGKYCVSLFDDAEINELISCFNFKELVFPLTDTLVIETFTPNQATLELDSISLRNTPQSKSNSKSNSLNIKVIQASATHLQPILKSNERIVLGSDGKATNVDGETEKSFVQKYWYYMVPPLILFMIASPQ